MQKLLIVSLYQQKLVKTVQTLKVVTLWHLMTSCEFLFLVPILLFDIRMNQQKLKRKGVVRRRSDRTGRSVHQSQVQFILLATLWLLAW